MSFRFSLIFLSFLFSSTLFSQRRIQDPDTKKWGFVDDEWNVIIPAIYDEIQPRFDTIIAVKKDGMMAALDEKGNFRIPLIYEQIMPNLNPFRTQFGYAAVTKNIKKRNSWGMVDSRGKVILPEKFQYVRAISPDILVGRTDGDTLLQFFNLKGGLLYKITGKSVEPGRVDDTCFEVNGIDHKTRYVKLDGSWVYPDDPRSGIWTDDRLTMLWRDGKVGAINQKGETVIPFEYYTIKPSFEGQFIVAKKVNSMNASVLDKNGKVVIPERNHAIHPLDGVYMVTDISTDKKGIYDQKGKEILPVKYHFSSVHISSEFKNIPDSYPRKYISVKDKETQVQFLVKKDGTVIRPEGAKGVHYFSEKHPFIVDMPPASDNKLPKRKLVNQYGKDLVPAIYERMEFTMNPRIMIAAKEITNENMGGFLYLDAPEKTDLNMPYPYRLFNGYYRLNKGYNYQLYSPEIKLIHTGEYTSLSNPDRNHYEQFHNSNKLAGRLVAVGFQRGMTYGDWIGVNDEGATFLFKKEEIKTIKKTNEPSPSETAETIMEETSPHMPAPEKVHTWVRQPPQFKGSGMPAMINFIKNNKQYPAAAMEQKTEGTVVVNFIVEKDGSLTDIKIEKGIGNGCNEEAIRLVQSMPKWKPGRTSDNKIVRVKYTLPIEFKLGK